MMTRYNNFLKSKCLVYLYILLISTSCSPISHESPEMKPLSTTSSPIKTISPTATIYQPTPTVQPSPEAISEPSITPDLVPSFSLASSHKTMPSDVLREVIYSPKGGGPNCDNGITNDRGLIVAAEPSGGELMEAAVLFVCGWQFKERVEITVLYPDGQEKSSIQVAEKKGSDFPEILYWFIPKINDPPGIYIFTAEGVDRQFIRQAKYDKPSGPRLYPIITDSEISWWDFLGYTKNKPTIKQMLLYGLLPNEEVRFMAYKKDNSNDNYSFLAWQEFQVNSDGSLLIDIDIGADGYAAIGELSGEIPLLHYGPYGNLGSSMPSVLNTNKQEKPGEGIKCSGAPPQRVEVGIRALVCTKSDKLIIRSEPLKGNNEISRISPGTPITIIDGPSCANNWSWWKIKTDNDVIGWVAEGGDRIDPYFICPVE